jgi:hypothetical protein
VLTGSTQELTLRRKAVQELASVLFSNDVRAELHKVPNRNLEDALAAVLHLREAVKQLMLASATPLLPFPQAFLTHTMGADLRRADDFILEYAEQLLFSPVSAACHHGNIMRVLSRLSGKLSLAIVTSRSASTAVSTAVGVSSGSGGGGHAAGVATASSGSGRNSKHTTGASVKRYTEHVPDEYKAQQLILPDSGVLSVVTHVDDTLPLYAGAEGDTFDGVFLQSTTSTSSQHELSPEMEEVIAAINAVSATVEGSYVAAAAAAAAGAVAASSEGNTFSSATVPVGASSPGAVVSTAPATASASFPVSSAPPVAPSPSTEGKQKSENIPKYAAANSVSEADVTYLMDKGLLAGRKKLKLVSVPQPLPLPCMVLLSDLGAVMGVKVVEGDVIAACAATGEPRVIHVGGAAYVVREQLQR